MVEPGKADIEREMHELAAALELQLERKADRYEAIDIFTGDVLCVGDPAHMVSWMAAEMERVAPP